MYFPLIQRSSYTTALTGKVREEDDDKEARMFGFIMIEDDDNDGNLGFLTGAMKQSDGTTNCVLTNYFAKTIPDTDRHESIYLKLLSVSHVRMYVLHPSFYYHSSIHHNSLD